MKIPRRPAPYWIRWDRNDHKWKVGSLVENWPVPFPRFDTWREAFDFALTAACVRHVVADTINTMQEVS